MADAGLSNLVLFIASLIVAASVAGVFATEVGYLTEDIDDLGFDTSNTVRVDIELINDVGSPMYDVDGNGQVRLYVKNTGVRELSTDPGTIDVLLDGEFQSEADLTVTVLDGGDWTPGRVVQLDVDAPGLASGTHRVVVRIDDHAETLEFTV